ncbi:MAG: U32 family peptidase, partial [Desulfovibrionaceae bacterium]|nr:U32 family peptidase [Desulfovibrionaceae bacterium]
VVVPRELSIDEIRAMGESCPDGLELECFIHGALCYCVSGRCYWSSYMGGKSGLRGRCVQPCRRVYTQGPTLLPLFQRAQQGQQGEGGRGRQEQHRFSRQGQGGQRPQQVRLGKGQTGRYFSCQDLSLDVLTKTLVGIPNLVSWKIEGRKKGPHYVYHTVTAYRMLRDNPGDTEARKMADDILAMALGRPTTHARFLPQRQNVPVDPAGQTSSGLLVGKIGISQKGEVFIKPHVPLMVRDYLRVGVEDEKWHSTLPVTRSTPKAGTLVLRLPKHKTPRAGVPVYLIDRREPELEKVLADWRRRLGQLEARPTVSVSVNIEHTKPAARISIPSMTVHASLPHGKETRGARAFLSCLWLTPRSADLSRTILKRFGWWLPPVLWADEEASMQRMVSHLWREGARTFVLNAPWQMALFSDEMRQDEDARLVAGPFCNLTNGHMAQALMKMGFHAATVSPELPGEEMLSLPSKSPLPLGVVLQGAWPVGISRFGSLGVRLNEPFASPKGEIFWARQYGENVWIYPGWPLDLSEKRQELEKAGYSFMVTLQEKAPSSLPALSRPGLFNWETPLL